MSLLEMLLHPHRAVRSLLGGGGCSKSSNGRLYSVAVETYVGRLGSVKSFFLLLLATNLFCGTRALFLASARDVIESSQEGQHDMGGSSFVSEVVPTAQAVSGADHSSPSGKGHDLAASDSTSSSRRGALLSHVAHATKGPPLSDVAGFLEQRTTQGGSVPQAVAGFLQQRTTDEGGSVPQAVAGFLEQRTTQGGSVPQAVAGFLQQRTTDEGGSVPQAVAGFLEQRTTTR